LRHAFKRLVGSVGGLTLVVVGIPIFVTPIPLGSPMIVLGLLLLLQTSARARLLRRLLARRYPETARRFDSARRQIQDLFKRTRAPRGVYGWYQPTTLANGRRRSSADFDEQRVPDRRGKRPPTVHHDQSGRRRWRQSAPWWTD
jgi:hypothetical protein